MAAGRSPVVEGRPQVAGGTLAVDTLVVVDTLAAAGGRPLAVVLSGGQHRVAASVFLGWVGTPHLP